MASGFYTQYKLLANAFRRAHLIGDFDIFVLLENTAETSKKQKEKPAALEVLEGMKACLSLACRCDCCSTGGQQFSYAAQVARSISSPVSADELNTGLPDSGALHCSSSLTIPGEKRLDMKLFPAALLQPVRCGHSLSGRSSPMLLFPPRMKRKLLHLLQAAQEKKGRDLSFFVPNLCFCLEIKLPL